MLQAINSDKFVIDTIKEISRGTFSTVFYCEGNIAVKTISHDAPRHPTLIYENDLDVLLQCGEHPNIVRLISYSDSSLVSNKTDVASRSRI